MNYAKVAKHGQRGRYAGSGSGGECRWFFRGCASGRRGALVDLTAQINDLEAELGVRLFHRTTRKLSLTEVGQIYYERAGRIITEVDEARLAVSELGSPTGIRYGPLLTFWSSVSQPPDIRKLLAISS